MLRSRACGLPMRGYRVHGKLLHWKYRSALLRLVPFFIASFWLRWLAQKRILYLESPVHKRRVRVHKVESQKSNVRRGRIRRVFSDGDESVQISRNGGAR